MTPTPTTAVKEELVINLLDAWEDVTNLLISTDWYLNIFTYNPKNVEVLIHQLIYHSLDLIANKPDGESAHCVNHILLLNGCTEENVADLNAKLTNIIIRSIQHHFTIPIVASGLCYEAIELNNRFLRLRLM